MSEYHNLPGINSAWNNAIALLRPPPELKPSEWAERNIKIPIGNAIPGYIRFDNAPYQREPLDMLADPSCHRVTLMWGAQTGKTNLLNCAMAYFIAHQPQSQIMMQPSQGDLHTWLETKFNPMVEGNEVLKYRIAKPRSREGVNNQQLKSYPGGFLMFSWAGSPRTMRGRSAPRIYCDEVDGYEYNAEGHPVNLLWQRAATFGDAACLFDTSTPTIKGLSFIESAYEAGDQRRYHIPCPHCDTFITLEWENVQWDKDPDTGEHLIHTAQYYCQSCGGQITDGMKVAALRKGKWIGKKPFTGHASFHLRELYSFFRKWRDIVRSFLEKKHTGDLQSFVNVSLAETYEEQGDYVVPDGLLGRKERYTLPLPAKYRTMGVDVQKDRLEFSVIDWGDREEAWLIDHIVIAGDTAMDEPWHELAEMLDTFQPNMVAIDSGFNTGKVKEFVAKRKYCHAIKGVSGSSRPIIEDKLKRAKRLRTRRNINIPVEPIGVDSAKALIYARLKVNEKGAGYIHFPDEPAFDEEYFKQLTAEKRVTRFSKGRPYSEWIAIRPRNEALDCFVYALAALRLGEVVFERRLEISPPPPVQQQEEAVKEEIPVSPAQTYAPPSRKKSKPIKSSYLV